MNHKVEQEQIKILLESKFPAFDKGLVEKISELGSIIKVPAGEQILKSGQYLKNTILVVQGLVKLYREEEEGKEFFIYYIEEGTACALSMVCATKNLTSDIMAKTIQDTTLIVVPLQYMDELMVKYKSWYYFVIDTYRTKFQDLLNVVDAIAFKALDIRLIRYLNNAYYALDTDVLNVTHQEIAADLNTSREVISRLLKKMEKEGMVGLNRNQIIIKNLPEDL
jgi:CRP/FNR family transcriptional regulator, anaerobic regulatory protein